MSHSFFWMREALGEQEAICRDAQRGMVMKTAPTAPFEMVQSELLLEFLIVALDAPPQFRHPHQFLERRAGRERGQKILDRLCFVLGPFDEQPFFRAQCAALTVKMSTAHAHGGKARGQRLISAFPPGDFLPLPWRERYGQPYA